MAEIDQKDYKVKTIVNMLITAFFGAILTNVLIGFNWKTFFVSVVFFALLNRILSILDEDSPTKRVLQKLFIFVSAFILYLGFRTIFGYLFDMPLIGAWNALNGIGIAGIPTQGNLPVELIIELLIIAPGISLAWLMVKGGKKTRGWIGVLSFLMLTLVVFQLKQPGALSAVKRNTQAQIDLGASRLNLDSIKKEVLTKITWGYALVPVTHVYEVETDSNGKITKATPVVKVIKTGDTVQMVEAEAEPKMYDGQLLTNIRLINQTTDSFIGGDTKYWVETGFFEWKKDILSKKEDTGKIKYNSATASDFKIYQKGTYTFSLNAGEELDHWITFPNGVYYDIRSKDDKFKLIYSDGEIIPAWTPGKWPSKYKFKVIAVVNQPAITMKVY